MFRELIIYNYDMQVNQTMMIKHLNDLLDHLRSHDCNVDFLKIIDGNEEYRSTFDLIGRVINYWAKDGHPLPTYDIYLSFWLLYDFLKQSSTKDAGKSDVKDSCLASYYSQSITADLTGLIENDSTPAFFNSIIITGELYHLEMPYGAELYDILDGGMCLNANTHRNSIWHETAHLLGAKDHYVDNNHHQSTLCKTPDRCLMQWDSLKGSHFCVNSIEEIRTFLNQAT